MPTIKDAQSILETCKAFATERGLKSGLKADIDGVELDFVTPPNDFLGVHSNPAIFVNEDTYKFLHKHHPTWKLNQTIAVKADVLSDLSKMNLIGIIAHEAGHAFHVAAEEANTEQNAYIFEVEILLHWFDTNHPIMKDVSQQELLDYFESRKPYYKAGIGLHETVDEIEVTIYLPLKEPVTLSADKKTTKPLFSKSAPSREVSIFPPSRGVLKPINQNRFFNLPKSYSMPEIFFRPDIEKPARDDLKLSENSVGKTKL